MLTQARLILFLLASQLLLAFPHVEIPLQSTDAVDEENPVEVVDLVLETEAIDADDKLDGDQKRVLLDMYKALVRSNGSVAPKKQEK